MANTFYESITVLSLRNYLNLHYIVYNFRPPNTRTEMYAGRVACYPWWVTCHVLVCAARPINVGKTRWDRQTDGRTPDRCITLTAIDATSIKLVSNYIYFTANYCCFVLMTCICGSFNTV